MRQNLPVTTQERTFPAGQKLISTTDLKGTITYANDAFVAISGFARSELVGQHHNVVRHPDMPPAAFKTMWQHLQQGKPWMGLVKNRCKNGDFYWVHAYVTPISEMGKVVGYESVRVAPDRQLVQHAATLYAQINAGKTPQGRGSAIAYYSQWFALPALTLLGAAGAAASGALAWAAGLAALSALSAMAATQFRSNSELATLQSCMQHPFTDPLAVLTYARHGGALGAMEVALTASNSHLDTMLTRIEDSATTVAQRSVSAYELSSQAVHRLEQQQQQTELVATAMHQMTTTIAEVASHVQETATKANDADGLARQGSAIAKQTREAILQLQQTVNGVSQAVTTLAGQTSLINQAAQIIEQIADQTNLLALNAAIEAARAGEQGRGFAVVADEVRHLASRTTESTQQIYQIIRQLSDQAKSSVTVAEDGVKDAAVGVAKVQEAEQMLSGISDVVMGIASMATQMAAAVEQQSHVAEDINQQVVSISTLATESMQSGNEVCHSSEQLNNTAEELHELVLRFRRDA